MITIYKIKEALKPSDEFLSNLTDPPIAHLINEKIILSLMVAIKSDMGALEFCDIMEQLIDTRSSDIEIIRNGNFSREIIYAYVYLLKLYQAYQQKLYIFN